MPTPAFTIRIAPRPTGTEACVHGRTSARQFFLEGPGVPNPGRYNLGCGYEEILRLTQCAQPPTDIDEARITLDEDDPFAEVDAITEPESEFPHQRPALGTVDIIPDRRLLTEFRGGLQAPSRADYLHTAAWEPRRNGEGVWRMYPEFGFPFPAGNRQIHVAVFPDMYHPGQWKYSVKMAGDPNHLAQVASGYASIADAKRASWQKHVSRVLQGLQPLRDS